MDFPATPFKALLFLLKCGHLCAQSYYSLRSSASSKYLKESYGLVEENNVRYVRTFNVVVYLLWSGHVMALMHP